MFVPFESLPPTSRVWVFQASRPLTAPEMEAADAALRAFTDEWAVHGTPMETSYNIRHNRFIVLAADESRQAASGCSIDSSVRVLKEIEIRLDITLLDRNQVAFLRDDNVEAWPLNVLKEKFTGGILNEHTLTFNNLISTKAELEDRWLLPVSETWVKRYLPNALANV